MKQIAFFVRDRENPTAIQYLKNNLENILGDYVEITTYYLDEMDESQIVEADAYLILYEEMLRYLVRHIHDFSKVVVTTRSIQKKQLEPVSSIPKNTDVLVVNDSRESILQTVYMLYELGFNHLNLLPYDKELQESGAYDNIRTCIVTNGLEYLIPPQITNICNIHNREISFETFQKLITLLDLENPVVQSNLMHKVNEDLDTGVNFINSYLSNFLKEQLLNNVIENLNQAILLLDSSAKIHYINEKGYKIFHLMSGDDFHDSACFTEELFEREDFKDELMLFNSENYLVEKKSIILHNGIIGYCLILQNEKDLRDSEVNLNQQLKTRGLYAKYRFSDIVHQSASMKQCIKIAKQVAATDYTILIRGESGTGKELLAQSIHNYSLRKNAPFVAVNCAALPESLLESELFGYEAGSFTGAQKNGKIGLFEQAQRGTIFLDEIGDISPNLQSRLLRVIQEKQIMRIGSDKIINIDVRIIAATNVNLEKQIVEGKFRNDLFYRLNVITLNIAPLRERTDDILPLLQIFLGKEFNNITPKDQTIFLQYSWPGNIRELENVAAYYHILGTLPQYLYSDSNQLLTRETTKASVHIQSEPLPSASGTAALSSTPKIPTPSGADLKTTVLSIIAQNSDGFHGIGRTGLCRELAKRNLPVGEGKLRSLLSELQKQELIQVSLGRTGSQISPKGREFLKQCRQSDEAPQ